MEEDFTFAYEKFLMDCALGSKTNLIIRAEEISIKKIFFKKLKEKCGESEANILLEMREKPQIHFIFSFRISMQNRCKPYMIKRLKTGWNLANSLKMNEKAALAC